MGTVALCILRHEKLLNKWDEFLAQSPHEWGEIGHALVEPPELILCQTLGLTRTWPVDEPVAAKHVRGLVGSLCRKVPRVGSKKSLARWRGFGGGGPEARGGILHGKFLLSDTVDDFRTWFEKSFIAMTCDDGGFSRKVESGGNNFAS